MARPKKDKGAAPKKPRAAKAAAAAAPEIEAAKPSEVQRMVPPNILKSYLRKAKKAKEDMSEISGTLGPDVANMVERFGTNRKALSVVKTAFSIKDNEKLADFIEQLHYLLDASGCNERASKATGKLGLEGGQNGVDEEEETGSGETDESQDNVATFPATRQAALN